MPYRCETRPQLYKWPDIQYPPVLVYKVKVCLNAECFEAFWREVYDAYVTQRVRNYDPYDSEWAG